MSFLVDPSKLRSLHCPSCNAMYNTRENVPCLNSACGHTLCGRCIVFKVDQNCGVEECPIKVTSATQGSLSFSHNRVLLALIEQLPQFQITQQRTSSAGSLSAPSVKSAVSSAPPPAYGSPAPVPRPLYRNPPAQLC